MYLVMINHVQLTKHLIFFHSFVRHCENVLEPSKKENDGHKRVGTEKFHYTSMYMECVCVCVYVWNIYFCMKSYNIHERIDDNSGKWTALLFPIIMFDGNYGVQMLQSDT